jgi:hypothetical protein
MLRDSVTPDDDAEAQETSPVPSSAPAPAARTLSAGRRAAACGLCEAVEVGSGLGKRASGHRACCGGHASDADTDTKGHLPECELNRGQRVARAAVAAADGGPQQFGVCGTTKMWLGTIGLRGIDAPEAWLVDINQWNAENEAEAGFSDTSQERGTIQEHRHFHSVIKTFSDPTSLSKGRMTRSLKEKLDWRGVGVVTIQWKPVYKLDGARWYIAKDAIQDRVPGAFDGRDERDRRQVDGVGSKARGDIVRRFQGQVVNPLRPTDRSRLFQGRCVQ